MKTAVEKIIEEIDNEVDFLKRYEYISEVHGRMIGLAFAKRVALEAKEMEKKQVIEARNNGFMASAEGWNGEYGIKDFNLLTEEIKSEEYFNKTFKTK